MVFLVSAVSFCFNSLALDPARLATMAYKSVGSSSFYLKNLLRRLALSDTGLIFSARLAPSKAGF